MTDHSNNQRNALLVAVFGALLGGVFSALPVMFPPDESPQVVRGIALSTLVVGALLAVAIAVPALKRTGKKVAWGNFLRFTPIAVLVLFLGLFVLVVSWLITERSVVVPSLKGVGFAQAKSELGAFGLSGEVIVGQEGADDDTPITHQSPPAGTRLMKGSAVRVVVGEPVIDVTITSPSNGGSVNQERIVVQGSSKGLADSGGRLHASLLLQPLEADGYWLYGPLSVGADGTWKKPVNLGAGTGGLPQRYDLIVIVTLEPLIPKNDGGGPDFLVIPSHITKSSVSSVTRSR